jgi:hypothetical protein
MPSNRGLSRPSAVSPWVACVVGLLGLALAGAQTRLLAQDNVLDLRLVEVNGDGDVTYQNFIYARSLADGRFLAQALYLRLPQDSYGEVAVGGGVRAALLGDLSVYLMASLAKASDASYAQPALFLQDAQGRLTGSLYLQRYTPLNDDGVAQWLVDALEAQYGIAGPVAIGAALHAYRPEGGDWLTKLGPKLVVSDRFGTTEIRATWLDAGGGHEFQIRRVWVF